MKLLIIGIDGATFDLVRPWVQQGQLPNLARLIQGGVSADLASTLPPVTSPAWPTFMTGSNPGKHGVFDFIQPQGADFSLVNSTKIRQPTIWQRLSNAGLRVGVLNVPVTYPPQTVNGFMVTGILSPKSGQICHPPDLIGRYRDRLGDYRVAPDIQFKAGIEDAYLKDIYDLIRVHGDWALALMEHEPWDVLMTHFIALDVMMHAMWRHMDAEHPHHKPGPYEHAIRDGYRLVDEYVGRMLALAPADTTTIVMSDHGFGPLHKIVNLNVFLMQKGFLKLKRDVVTRLKAAAFHLGMTPAGVYHMIETIGLQNLATRVSKETRNQVVGRFLSFNSVDWQRTVAYSMGHVGQIYLNVAGREPQGIVTPETYESTRQEVIDALHTLRADDGRPLVTDLILREETYQGPYAEQGPDIHLVLDDYNMIAFPLFATNNAIIADQIRGDSGCHRREGIFIAHGPSVRDGDQFDEFSILDLAPTVMALLGQPVPQEMDGRVLQDIFTTPLDVTYTTAVDGEEATPKDESLQESDARQIEERLRSLGYL